jgi:hypothetical protein
MKFIKVIFADGNYLFTSINGTVEEIRAYYLGKFFNIGTIEDNLVQAVDVQFI